MKPFFKRALAGVATVAVAAGIAPLLTASPAAALGVLQGSATINTSGGAALLQSGNSATTFTLRLPANAACPGDSANAGWRFQTYMVSGAIDPATLEFGSSGPTGPSTGTYATFKQPLYTTSFSPIVNRNTADAASANGPGPILGIPDMNFEVHNPGDVPTGVYNLGIACTLGGASATQMSNFWNVQMTITADPGGPGNADVLWQNGTVPSAPSITAVTPQAVVAGTGQASVAFTNPAANPALTGCTAFVGTTPGGTEFSGAGGSAVSCSSPAVVLGLTYGQQYYFRLSSTNAVGTSLQSNELSATPVRPAVTNLTALPSPNAVDLNWDDAPLLGSDTYNVAYCTLPATSPCTSAAAGYVATLTPGSSAAAVTPTVAGQLYTFTVTYGAAGTSIAATVQSTPLSNSILVQDITVGRPNGALVLTQVCGKWDEMASEAAQFGFPDGLPLSAASAAGTAPVVGAGPGTDPEFDEYPYPSNPDGTANASYPTTCGVALGAAQLVTDGGPSMGAGQFFAAHGRLNQISVVDTRDTDPGWAVNFTMSDLSSGSDTLSGNQLGWSAVKTDTPAFTDGFGNSYDQNVTLVTPSMVANTAGAAGAGSAHSVIQALDANDGLGIATLDARLKLLIPIHALNGTYAGTLTINAL